MGTDMLFGFKAQQAWLAPICSAIFHPHSHNRPSGVVTWLMVD